MTIRGEFFKLFNIAPRNQPDDRTHPKVQPWLLGMMHMRKRVKHTILRYSLPSVEVGIPTLAEAYELGK